MILNEAGEPPRNSRRLTSWAGFCLDQASYTTDSKRLVFKETRQRGTVFVAATNAGNRLSPRQLTFSDAWESPATWTHDSKAIIFSSNRSGNFSIYKQALDSDIAEPLVTGPDNYFAWCLSPDGHWLLYNALTKDDTAVTPDRVMRIPITGGPAELVVTGQRDIYGVWCTRAPAMQCVISERTPDRKQLVLSALDVMKGRGQVLTQIETEPSAEYAADLSPDGRHVVIAKSLGEGSITILSLAGNGNQQIPVKGLTGLGSVTWAADGKGLLVTRHVQRSWTLLSVDLKGNVRELWTEVGASGFGVVPSPDSRHLAFQSTTDIGNMWMMESF
jgi:Tol biopolymer transport system component